MILQLETPAPESALCQRIARARIGLREALIATSQPALHNRVHESDRGWPATPVPRMPYQKKHFWQRLSV